ncbi:hypothetical protein [Micromonospora sp. HM5-17]|uniref:hypothetical protein n=1 Tax=Micromonospora sp. HM5-17 TaxID=2487710 RepID=UPI000F469577|nr:hypothetical protein [Micromonospora sp. HM5-17]ROT31932.1 hypothetical protein EF879_09800 [Micromonospora sp. HM5-17]
MAQRNSSGRGATATATKRRPSSGTDINKIKMMKVEDLRGQLRKRGISGISALRKMDLVNRLVRTLRAESRGGAAAKKAAAKAPAKKAPARRTAAKTIAAAPGKRAGARKTVTAKRVATARKAPAKKAPAKRAPAKRAVAKRAPAKKTVAKRAPAKRGPAGKAAAKPAPARKTTAAARQSAGGRKATTATVRKTAGARKAVGAGTKAPGTRTATTAAVRQAAAGTGKTTAAPARKATTGARKRTSAAGQTRPAGGGTSKTLKYAQPITSTQDQPERPGRSLVTRDHDVIRRWAEARNAQPATIEGTEREGRLGVLTFDFPGWREGGGLRPVSWDEWFETFDLRRLNFIYQEQLSDGRQSNFFRTESPDREEG